MTTPERLIDRRDALLVTRLHRAAKRLRHVRDDERPDAQSYLAWAHLAEKAAHVIVALKQERSEATLQELLVWAQDEQGTWRGLCSERYWQMDRVIARLREMVAVAQSQACGADTEKAQ